MRKHVAVLTMSGLVLLFGAMTASAQQTLDLSTIQQSSEQQTEQQLGDEEGTLTIGQGGMMGPGMMGQDNMMGRGMMGQAGSTGRGPAPRGMGDPVMMRILFSLVDSDGDGTVSLQEFQAAHERIFKAMDANKDGRLTLEEMQAFMQGRRTRAPAAPAAQP